MVVAFDGTTCRFLADNTEYATFTSSAIPAARDFVMFGHSGGSSTTVASYNFVSFGLIPEPASLALLALGALAMVRRRR